MRGFDRFTDKFAVAMRVGSQLWDLSRELPPDALPEPVYLDSAEGLSVLRHSCAHVLAQAVQRLFPEVKLGIGPSIKDGFYYDFYRPTPFVPDDLPELEKVMQAIIKSDQRFVRVEVEPRVARQRLAEEPFKLELIDLHTEADSAPGPRGAESGEILSIYENRDREGRLCWQDLCRGPHLPSTRYISPAFALTHLAAAYWRGSEKNPQLQRVYGTAWATKEALRAHRLRLEEAAKRDHRRLGQQLDLFSFPEEIGSGLPVFHTRGGIIRQELENYARKRHLQSGYDFVYTPHITKAELFEKSGHLQWYREGMFPPMYLDETKDAQERLVRAGADYYLKPMNCPFHNLIYSSRPRSYRDLPLRLVEFGTVYRYEKSGSIHGLTRVRGLTQDDAHIYTSLEDLENELSGVLSFVISLLADYGLDDFYLELSTRDPKSDKFLGEAKLWERATRTLERVGQASGLKLVDDPGGAAFYGPKISVQARDAIGRSWQTSTIQLDFNLPERFNLEYTDSSGTRQRPIMIHRALFGSIERFFAILLEHYAGAFPLWLAPVQVVGVPVADEHLDYLSRALDKLTALGVRVEIDESDERMNKKIRRHSRQKTPLIMIVGDRDQSERTVSLRFRDGSQQNGLDLTELSRLILTAIAEKRQISSAKDLV